MAFSEQKVLIVGGSSGIGLATAQAAVAAGAQVVITGRNEYSLTWPNLYGTIAAHRWFC